MSYYVYIMSNHTKVLYVGVTNNLSRRIYEHKNELVHGFTSKYKLKVLVYYCEFSNPTDAITQEKRIKGWLRSKKLALIHELNPDFNDLSPD